MEIPDLSSFHVNFIKECLWKDFFQAHLSYLLFYKINSFTAPFRWYFYGWHCLLLMKRNKTFPFTRQTFSCAPLGKLKFLFHLIGFTIHSGKVLILLHSAPTLVIKAHSSTRFQFSIKSLNWRDSLLRERIKALLMIDGRSDKREIEFYPRLEQLPRIPLYQQLKWKFMRRSDSKYCGLPAIWSLWNIVGHGHTQYPPPAILLIHLFRVFVSLFE